MKQRRLILSLLVGVLACASSVGLVACSKGQKGSATPAGVGVLGPDGRPVGTPAHFRHIPADSLFVMTTAAPLPDATARAYMDKVVPSMAKAVATLKDLPGEDTGTKVARALGIELEGYMTVDGIAKLGLSLRGEVSVYTIGLYPVARWEATDPAAARAFVQRVIDRSGATPELVTAGSEQYWKVTEDKITIMFGVSSQALFAAMVATTDLARVAPMVLGQTNPERNMATDKILHDLIGQYRFQPYSIGFLNVRGLAEGLLGDAKGFAEESRKAFGIDVPASPVCKQELYDMIAFGSRMVFGMERYDASGGNVVTQLESQKAAHMADLAGLAVSLPGMSGGADTSLFRMGFGVDVAKAIDLVKRWSATMAAAPYQCEWFAEVNKFWSEAGRELDEGMASMPPFVTSLKGFGIVLHELELTSGTPTKIKGLALVKSADASQLVAAASAFVPQLAGIKIPSDGSVVSVPLPVAPLPGLNSVKVAQKGKMIAAGVGNGIGEELTTLVSSDKDEDGAPLLVFGMDYKGLADLLASTGSDAFEGISALGRYVMGLRVHPGGVRVDIAWTNQ